MSKGKIRKILSRIFVCLFVTGVVLGLFGRAICVRHTTRYQKLQPELRAPDVITTVLQHHETEQIYVCYNDASYVNVYSKNGEFLWAVSTPYLRNVEFEIQDDKLIVCGDEAYIYNAINGEFIECKNFEDVELDYYDEEKVSDKIIEGEVYYDTYQVYIGNADGTLKEIVSRPWWYWIFNFLLCWCIGVVGAIGIGILMFLEKREEYVETNVKKDESSEAVIISKKIKSIIKYYRITSAVHIVYIIANVISAFFNIPIFLGIIPLVLHFIIASGITDIMFNRQTTSTYEQKCFKYWKTVLWVTLIVDILSMLVVASVIEL